MKDILLTNMWTETFGKFHKLKPYSQLSIVMRIKQNYVEGCQNLTIQKLIIIHREKKPEEEEQCTTTSANGCGKRQLKWCFSFQKKRNIVECIIDLSIIIILRIWLLCKDATKRPSTIVWTERKRHAWSVSELSCKTSWNAHFLLS